MHFGLASSSKEKLMEGNERTKGGELGGAKTHGGKGEGGDYR